MLIFASAGAARAVVPLAVAAESAPVACRSTTTKARTGRVEGAVSECVVHLIARSRGKILVLCSQVMVRSVLQDGAKVQLARVHGNSGAAGDPQSISQNE